MSLHLFDFREAISNNYISALPSDFNISSTTTYDILLLRILTGNVKIYSKKLNKEINLEKNYFSFPFESVNRKSTKQLREFLNPFSFDQYIKFSKKYYPRNLNFYNNLLQEITFYFYYSNEGQHQAAFVNLYRILEYISYSFPLIHSSNFGNYIGTFEAFRKYFTDTNSEITFLDRFIENLFRGTVYLSLSTDFQFTHTDSIIANNCFDAFQRLHSGTWLLSNKATQSLSIENKHVISLFKNTRNRYFHFAIGSGQKNIRNTDLKDPDFFFEKINSKFLNWICFVYGTVIIESLDNSLL